MSNSAGPKAFEWLSGGLFFGNHNQTSSKGNGIIEEIDSENDVNDLLNGIQEDLTASLLGQEDVLSPTSDQDKADLSRSDLLAARLARLRFLLYDERRVTTQQAENYGSHKRPSPSVAIRAVECLSSKSKTKEMTTDHDSLETLIPDLINNLQSLPFESRKHVAAIFNYLLVCGFDGIDRDIYVPVMNTFKDYVADNFEAVLSPIVNGHNVPPNATTDVVLHCGSMYRSCFKHATLYGQLVVTTRRVEQFVFPFLDKFCLLPNFDVSSDAMESLKVVMIAGTIPPEGDNEDYPGEVYPASAQEQMAELAATFLIRDYEAIWKERFNAKLLAADANYMTKRVALQILSTVLLTRSNYSTMIRYVNSRSNLILVMKLLRDTSPHITLDAFHVFKVFVANPNKIPEVEKILKDNSQKLVAYLETLHSDKEASDQQFADEKRLIIATIKAM